jgi:hypothetical protein
MLRSRGLALVLSCTVLAVVACSGGADMLDGKQVERTIVAQLRRDFVGAPVGAAKCPKQIKRKAGRVFQCTAAVAGEPVPITVTQTQGDPGYHAVREVAVLDVGKVQNFVQMQYDQQVGVQVTAACAPPGKSVIVAKPQTTIPCIVRDAQGTTDSVQVQVSDTRGNIKIATI